MYFRVLKHFEHSIKIKKQLINMYGLLTKCGVKMAGYWPSPFLRVYGPRWLHLARSGSQSHRAIWFIFHAREAGHVINQKYL